MTTYHKLYTRIVWIALFTVIAVFWLSVFRYSYNFPFYDDFENIVLFIHRFISTGDLFHKFALLFEQNFEHRVLFAKLVTLIQYLLTGYVNIQWLIILGNISLVGVMWLFYQYQRKDKLSLFMLLAIGCVLFQAQHYEDTISWATCSLQHAPCIFFSLWSFYLALNRRSVFASGALALLALFTSANGLAAVLLWIFIIVLTSGNRKKVILPATIVLIITAIHLTTLTIHSGSVLAHVTSHMGEKFVLLLSFSGQLADSNLLDKSFSVILGSFFLMPVPIVAVRLLLKKHRTITQIQWFCLAGTGALLFVGFLIVFARGVEPDAYGYQMDRYKIYAAFFAALAFGFYDGFIPRSSPGAIVRLAAAGLSLLFCIGTYYFYYGPILYYRSAIEANQFNFLWSKTIYYPLIYKDLEAKEYLAKAQKGYLRNTVPVSGNPLLQIDWRNVSGSLKVLKSEDESGIMLQDEHFIEDGDYDQLFVAAVDQRTASPRYLIKIESNYAPALKMFYTTARRPHSAGFSCLLYKNKMKQGEYDILLVSLKKGRSARLYHLLRTKI